MLMQALGWAFNTCRDNEIKIAALEETISKYGAVNMYQAYLKILEEARQNAPAVPESAFANLRAKLLQE